ncbi:MAG: SurA N-terminal domain-containing protein [Mariprofundaceae bacterium]|nr:SurA N-terminal domain-containing protein [Mariprofundaceae bacterium]
MLENIRNHAQSWLAKLILGGVALSFVLWGVGDYFLGSRVQTIAEVDGNPISDSVFYLAYERQLNIYRSALGKSFSKKAMESVGLKQKTLQTLINRHLVLDEAKTMGLVAPKSVLLARVRATPAFLSAGNFDSRRYEILTQNMGFRTPADYETNLRLDMMVDALQKAITGSAAVTDAEVRERFENEYEKRELTALIVRPEDIKSSIKISAKDARSYYDSHKNSYQSPLRLKLTAVVIDPAAIAKGMEVDDADIKAAYEEHKAQLVQPETRRASHILVRVSKNADANTRKLARAKIEKALKQIQSGKAFSAVAKKMSDDTTTKKGGDLGYFAQGAMVPAFDQAVFSMKKGETSGIVKTQFGFHIIRLTGIKPAREKPLDEVRNQLRQQLLRTKADEEAYQLSQDLDDALGREDNLTAAAASLNMKIREIGPVSMDEALADPLFAKDAGFRSQIFVTQPGASIDVTELADGRFAAVEVLKRHDPAILPFAKVTKAVYAAARQQAANKAARQQAESLLKDAAHTPLSQLGQNHGQAIYLSKQVRSNGVGDKDAAWLTSAVLRAAFFLAPDQKVVDHVLQVPQGFAVVQVKRVIAANDAEFAKQKKGIRSELVRSRGAVRFTRWMASVRARHAIKIYQDVLARF